MTHEHEAPVGPVGPVGPQGVARRRLLAGAAALAGGVVLAGCDDTARRPAAPARSRAADPAASSAPADPVGEGLDVPDTLVVDRSRTLSGAVSFAALDVRAGAVLELDPQTSTTVTLRGNAVVRGTLRMRPAHAGVVHQLLFTGVDESAFVGSTMGPVASDVGLWVMDRGRLDLRGTPRKGWNRRGRHPSWRPGDEVLRAPNAPGDYETYVAHPPGSPLPAVTGPDGTTHATEAFNLTRNVVVSGEEGGRAHVFVRSSRPQRITHALFQHLGPRRAATEGNAATEPVTGRYPVHFHMCGNGSRGSVVEGCVVRDSSRAFVPHASHGITMRDCLAFRILNDAFWWDEMTSSHDIVWEHCAVFDVRYDPEFRGTLGAFVLGLGRRVVIRDCVAVGSHGNGDDAGFQWPSFANQRRDNVWTATDLVAHNNRGDGVFVWQNDDNPHLVSRLTCYRNGQSGLQHGAYRNAYHYQDIVLFENGVADLRHNALAKDVGGLGQYQLWQRLWAPVLLISEHGANSTRAVRFLDSHVDRVTVDEWKSGGGVYEIHADLTADDFTVVDQKSTIRVVRPDGDTFTV